MAARARTCILWSVAVQLAISPGEPALDGLRSAAREDPELALVESTNGLDSVVELIASGGLDLVYALRRLGPRAQAIDADSSPAEICEQLARLARDHAPETR